MNRLITESQAKKILKKAGKSFEDVGPNQAALLENDVCLIVSKTKPGFPYALSGDRAMIDRIVVPE